MIKSNQNKCSVVIPVYNEEECIEGVIQSWNRQFIKMEITPYFICINDGSKDQSGRILDELAKEIPHMKVIHQENSGHGESIRRGYSHSLTDDTEYVFQIDSDNQFAPSDFQHLWEARHESDLILGRRKDRKDPLTRKIISSVLSDYVYNLSGCEILDANTPFRLYNKKFLKSVLFSIPVGSFTPNIMLSILGKKFGRNLTETPVKHFERTTGTNSLLSFGLLKACLKSFTQIYHFIQSLRYQYFTIEKSTKQSYSNSTNQIDDLKSAV
ncbi:glycosyltransferase family 2 protein [Bacteriovoracaceae bacterium]|nr:glycosyltransferase family 2 protein [Bacteriovoracaceae bacterium]|tara:strand:- start:26155 stop:26961 length:807 start_codon:yes stop_codon:yes gene_type:complete